MRKIEELPGEFKFEVGTEEQYLPRSRGGGRATVYVAQLPHSCDEWVIAADADPVAAVAEMERAGETP